MSSSSPQQAHYDLVNWATAVARILFCGRIDRSQVQKIIELANSVDEKLVFETLEAFAAYQAGRNQWRRDIARLFFEAIIDFKNHGGGREALLDALGYVKWIHRALEMARGAARSSICPGNFYGTTFTNLLKQTTLENVLNIAFK